MDGFTAGLVFWTLSLAAAYGVGHWMPQDSLGEDCYKKGEMVIRTTVYQCKPVAAYVNGERIELVRK